jgi:hypothetical protein
MSVGILDWKGRSKNLLLLREINTDLG